MVTSGRVDLEWMRGTEAARVVESMEASARDLANMLTLKTNVTLGKKVVYWRQAVRTS
jgi:hypothetical protein